MAMKLQMVDLKTQYSQIKDEITAAIQDVIDNTAFINGPQVKAFAKNLEAYLSVKHVIPCANGTDALQIALMALDLKAGDEVIVPAFTYVATAEVIALLSLQPVMVDVNLDDFNVDVEQVAKAITPRTKAIVPVHLFGQCADMDAIMRLAHEHKIYVVEDNAQAIGADYLFPDGRRQKAGTIGHIGCTSFFPSKNLGCYGDGGALFTHDDELAHKIRMIANHGQSRQYHHDVVGVNSRLDTIQAAILDVKLQHLDAYISARRQAADYYDAAFSRMPQLTIPFRAAHSSHVFHQYTLRVTDGRRDALKEHLIARQIPCAIYYPLPLYEQQAYRSISGGVKHLPATAQLCREVISLPMHTELNPTIQDQIIAEVHAFFNKQK